MSKKPQYWVVGATWNGEDMIETFINIQAKKTR